MCLRGKATYRNLSRYSDLSEKTYSRCYRQAFDFVEFNLLSLAPLLAKNSVWVAAVNGSFSEKAGNETYGVGMFYNGKHSKAERG